MPQRNPKQSSSPRRKKADPAKRTEASKKAARGKATKKKESRSSSPKRNTTVANKKKVNWIEDGSREQALLWLGHFSDHKALEKYATGIFRRELGLPKDEMFQIFHLDWCFSNRNGDIKQLVGRIVGSDGFIGNVRKLVRDRDISSYNSSIIVSDHFSDDEFEELATEADYIGDFAYDPNAGDRLIEEEKSPYLINHAHIWLAQFASKKRFQQYLKEVVTRLDEDKTPINELAADQRVVFYDHDLVYAEFMSKPTIEKLISCWGFSEAGVVDVLAKVQKKKKYAMSNACIVADKAEFSKPRSASGDGYEVWYIGSFEQCNK